MSGWDALADAQSYRERLRRYSADDLEDIYFNIHILRSPLHYKMLLMEMERRGLRAPGDAPREPAASIAERLGCAPWFRHHPALGSAFLALLVFACSAAMTLGLLLPIWLCQTVFHIRGMQASLVYLAWAPMALATAASGGLRLSGRTPVALAVVAGIFAGFWLFGQSGAPMEVLRVFFESRRSGGPSLMGGF